MDEGVGLVRQKIRRVLKEAAGPDNTRQIAQKVRVHSQEDDYVPELRMDTLGPLEVGVRRQLRMLAAIAVCACALSWTSLSAARG